MMGVSMDGVPSNVKWATFGIVPGALVGLGVQSANLLSPGTNLNALRIGGKAGVLASVVAFDIETLRNMPLPSDRNAAAAVGAGTGAVMLGATAGTATWLFSEATQNLSVGRQVGSTFAKAGSIGLVGGAVVGAVMAGRGQE